MKLKAKKKIILQPERAIELDNLTINRIDNYPTKRKVSVVVNELPQKLILWQDDNYDETCSWTLKDVENRIEELLEEKA